MAMRGIPLNKFISEVVRPGNFARQYNYTVDFTSPAGMSAATEEMLMRCETIVFPGQNISTTEDNLRIGPLRDHASNVTYGDITAVFFCSADLAERKFFEEWQNLIFNEDFQMGYYDQYKTDMVIKQYNEFHQNSYSVKVHEVYPKSFTDMELNTTEKTSFHKFTVTLSFYKYLVIDTDIIPPISSLDQAVVRLAQKIKGGL